MKLSALIVGGETAKQLNDVILEIKRADGAYRQRYTGTINAIRTAFNDDTLTFATMTDEQIKAFWLNGVGDAETILEARKRMASGQRVMDAIMEESAKFINDI